MSRAMIERYRHIRMAAKRETVGAITVGVVIEECDGVLVRIPLRVQAR